MLKRLLLVLAVVFLMESCVTAPRQRDFYGKIQDKAGNSYVIGYKDDAKLMKIEAVVTVKGYNYGCAVAYDKAKPDAMGFSLDASMVDATGTVMFMYKGIAVECERTNAEVPKPSI